MKGSVVKKGKKYYVVIDMGRDALGKRKQKWISGFSSEKEAEKELPRILIQYEDGELLNSNKITLEKLCENWLEYKNKYENLADTTRAGYENIINKHIIPLIGKLKTQEITTFHLQNYIDVKYNEGLKVTTLKNHRRVLRSLFIYSIDMEIINKNPMTKVKLPKGEKNKTAALELDDAKRLLEIVQKNLTLKMPVTLALLLGLRRGECLALTWDKIDFDNKIITIDSNLEYVDKKLIFKDVKTDKSNRKIAISDGVIAILKAHKNWQNEMRLRSGGTWRNDYNLVCTKKTTGKPLVPHSMSSNFKVFLKNNGFPHVRFHDLRHTNASIMLAAEIAPKIASNRLGHSSVGITLDLYSHVLENVDREVSDKIEELLIKKI